MIEDFKGDDCGIARDENHALFQWVHGKYRVVFSITQKGKALVAHFACRKESLRQVKKAIREFVAWCFENYACEVIFAPIEKKSVKRIVEKCGFTHLLTAPKGDIYQLPRCRHG